MFDLYADALALLGYLGLSLVLFWVLLLIKR